jgi:hypothetical protein
MAEIGAFYRFIPTFVSFGRSTPVFDLKRVCHDWYYILGTEIHNPESSLECTPCANHMVHDVLLQL